MNVRIVTSFNPEHWAAFARRNLESMLSYLPYEVVVYHEYPPDSLADVPAPFDATKEFTHDRLVWRYLWDVPGAREFVDEAAKFPPACGQFDRYDYNFDAHKFARKVYAQCDAAGEPGDILIWLDSDVEVLAPLSVGDIVTLMNGAPMARFARNRYHTETGIVFWDLRDPNVGVFFRHYRYLYDSRRIYTIRGGWHDCWALDAVVDALHMEPTNLTRHPERMEVVSSSELAHVFRHDKGPRKHVA